MGYTADDFKRWRAQYKGGEIAADYQKRLKAWTEDHDAYLKNYSDRFGGRNGDYSAINYSSDSQAWYDDAVKKSGALNDTANKLLAVL